MKYISWLVAGDEKFWVLVLGAVGVYLNTGPLIEDPALRTLVNSLIIACQGWLTANMPPEPGAAKLSPPPDDDETPLPPPLQ